MHAEKIGNKPISAITVFDGFNPGVESSFLLVEYTEENDDSGSCFIRKLLLRRRHEVSSEKLLLANL